MPLPDKGAIPLGFTGKVWKIKGGSSITTVRDILRTGSTGADVLFLQQVLGRWGYFVFVDGVFGGQTLQAVCAF